MAAHYDGHCLCGSTRYRVSGEPLTYYACHCNDCQRRTGAAFALSFIVRREAISLLSGEPARYSITQADGRIRAGRLCAECSTRLWGEPVRLPGIAIVQPGTLEQPIDLIPVAHIWAQRAQPWFVFPPGVPRFEGQPPDWNELLRLWQARK